jgi:hypothetical protein
VIAAIPAHIAIQTGSSTRYGDHRRDRQRSASGWIIIQNNGIVE